MKYLVALVLLVLTCYCAVGQGCDTLLWDGSARYTCPELAFYHYQNRYTIGDKNPSFTGEHKKHSRDSMPARYFTISYTPENNEVVFGRVTVYFDIEKNMQTGNIYLQGMEKRQGCRIGMAKPVHRTYTLIFTDGQIYKYTEPYFSGNFYDYFLLLRGKMRVLEIDQNGNAGKASFAQGDSILLKKLLTVPLKSIEVKATIDKVFRDKYDDEDDKNLQDDPPYIIAPADARNLMRALQCLVESK